MDVKLKCHVAPVKTSPHGLSGITENISRNGVLMLCADTCGAEQPRIGEVVTVEIELPENPVFGCELAMACDLIVTGESGQPFRVAFSVNQMKFTEYAAPASELHRVEAGASHFPV